MSRRGWLVGAALLVSAIAVACGSSGDGDARTSTSTSAVPASTPDLSDVNRPLTSREQDVARSLSRSFPITDFGIRSIDLTELISGGPGKDGIPAINQPLFVTQAEAAEWLADEEPVIALEINGEARAYPIQILIWHEIVNDSLGGVPVTVTFCPLCNTAITFDRRIYGEVTTFGVSGLLRRNDLIMFDRTRESLWQQITGEAIVGVDTTKRLTFLPSSIVSWRDFRATFPDAPVLSRETGVSRNYGTNPYRGYDRIGSDTIFRNDEFQDGELDAKERVVAVEIDGEAIAFPFSELSKFMVLDADVAGQPVVALWQSDTLSPFDDSFIVGGRNIGAAAAFSPLVNGERLTFEARDGQIVDTTTGSVWNVLGRAISGPMEGTALEPVLHANHFWFAWSVFQPETRVIQGIKGAG